jgi:hypothetical protein
LAVFNTAIDFSDAILFGSIEYFRETLKLVKKGKTLLWICRRIKFYDHRRVGLLSCKSHCTLVVIRLDQSLILPVHCMDTLDRVQRCAIWSIYIGNNGMYRFQVWSDNRDKIYSFKRNQTPYFRVLTFSFEESTESSVS